MELRAPHIAPLDRGWKLDSILSRRRNIIRVKTIGVKRVYKENAVFGMNAVTQFFARSKANGAPTHMRHLQAGIGRKEFDFSWHQGKALVVPELFTGLKQKLLPEADSHDRSPLSREGSDFVRDRR